MTLTADGRWLFAGRALRTFSFGYLSLALALYLAARGFSAGAIGGILTATLVEDAVFTALVSGLANRVGRRRVLTACSLLISFAGVMLAVGDRPWVLVVGAVLGTLSPSGQEAGPFSPVEQALLPATVSRDARTRVFAWYNVAGYVPAALGSLAAAAWLRAAAALGMEELSGFRALLWFYAANGVMLAAVALTTYGMPLVVELGIFFDVLVAVMILGILVYRIRETFSSMDTSKLSQLKG